MKLAVSAMLSILLALSNTIDGYRCTNDKHPKIQCAEYGKLPDMSWYGPSKGAILLRTEAYGNAGKRNGDINSSAMFEWGKDCRDKCLQSNRGFCPYKDGCKNDYCSQFHGKCLNERPCKSYAWMNLQDRLAGANCLHFPYTLEEMGGVQLDHPDDPDRLNRGRLQEWQFWNLDCWKCNKKSDCDYDPSECDAKDFTSGEGDHREKWHSQLSREEMFGF